MAAFVERHPLITYYAIAFAITWGGILLVVGPGGIPATPDQFKARLFLVAIAMMPGPSVAGILSTALVSGRAGLRELLSRFLRWRVGLRWYAVALLTAPVSMVAVPLALSLFFPAFVPGVLATEDRTTLVPMGIAGGLVAGFFEEIGWTGFAIPRWRPRHGVFGTGLIVGLLWGAWHLLVNVWSSGTSSGAISPALLLHTVLFSVGLLPPYRVLMVWVHERTGSVLVAMLMHASLTAGNMILIPVAKGGVLAVWSLVLAVTMWLVVAAVAAIRNQPLSPRSAPTSSAVAS